MLARLHKSPHVVVLPHVVAMQYLPILALAALAAAQPTPTNFGNTCTNISISPADASFATIVLSASCTTDAGGTKENVLPLGSCVGNSGVGPLATTTACADACRASSCVSAGACRRRVGGRRLRQRRGNFDTT